MKEDFKTLEKKQYPHEVLIMFSHNIRYNFSARILFQFILSLLLYNFKPALLLLIMFQMYSDDDYKRETQKRIVSITM